MSKVIIILSVMSICFIPVTVFAAGDPVSSNDLIDKASEYDGQTVVYTGEVIGDILNRGEYTWLNVSDGNNAIGIWVKSSDIEDITIAGRYDTRGDTIEITGIFHRACSDHGGDFDIHAEKTMAIQKGYAVRHDVGAGEIIIAGVLFTAALSCMAVILRQRYRAGTNKIYH